MLDKITKLAIVLLFNLTLSASAYADFGLSVDLNNSQTDNLMSNSSEFDSPIRSGALGLTYYPVAQLELSSSFKYTMYDDIYDTAVTRNAIITKTDISNSLYGFGATWIPTKSENRTNVYISMNFDRILYKDTNDVSVRDTDSILYQGSYIPIGSITDRDENVKAFDNAILSLKASIGYKYKPAIHLRAGAKFTNNNYLDEESIDADNAQYELFTGVNFSLPGSNSLDIEGGFGITSLQAITADTFDIKPNDTIQVVPGDYLEKDNFQNLYISPRLSRPIGKKTGVSLTFTYRHFTNIENSVILDYSTSFLSPWSSFYDGTSTVFRVKTYLVPNMVVTAGAGYWDKKYLRAIESNREDYTIVIEIPGSDPILIPTTVPWFTEPKDSPYRKEWLTGFYLNIKRPITNFFGFVIEPSLSIDYKSNSSTSSAYDYTSTTFSFGLSLSDNF